MPAVDVPGPGRAERVAEGSKNGSSRGKKKLEDGGRTLLPWAKLGSRVRGKDCQCRALILWSRVRGKDCSSRALI